MLQVKLAAVMMMPLAFFCSIASAQERQSDCMATQPAPSKDEVYGSYVPYKGPLLGMVPQRCAVASSTPPTTSKTSSLQATLNSTAEQPPTFKAEPQPPKIISSKCEPPTPRKDEVYGTYVPYTGPLLGMAPKCEVGVLPAADPQNLQSNNSSPLNLTSAPERQPDTFEKSADPSELKPALVTSSDLAPASNLAPAPVSNLAIAPAPSPGEPSSTSEYVRLVRTQPAATIPVR